jgi:hypothetical protein
MTPWEYWRVALLSALALIVLGAYFVADPRISSLLFWVWIISQGAWLAYWWSRRKKPSTK